jgi:hypothetical protein
LTCAGAARHSARAISERRLKITLVIGLLAGAAAVGLTLSQAPPTVARADQIEHAAIDVVTRRTQVCQPDEALPAHTSAIRLRAFAFLGPKVSVDVLAGKRLIAHGAHGSGWTGGDVTVALNPLPATRSGVTVCSSLFLAGDESVDLYGERAGREAAGAAAGPLRRLSVEYLRPGRGSWWSLTPVVATRMGLGHAPSGAWSVYLPLALMGGVIVLCARLTLRWLA